MKNIQKKALRRLIRESIRDIQRENQDPWGGYNGQIYKLRQLIRESIEEVNVEDTLNPLRGHETNPDEVLDKEVQPQYFGNRPLEIKQISPEYLSNYYNYDEWDLSSNLINPNNVLKALKSLNIINLNGKGDTLMSDIKVNNNIGLIKYNNNLFLYHTEGHGWPAYLAWVKV
jgi:hypothetical protein